MKLERIQPGATQTFEIWFRCRSTHGANILKQRIVRRFRPDVAHHRTRISDAALALYVTCSGLFRGSWSVVAGDLTRLVAAPTAWPDYAASDIEHRLTRATILRPSWRPEMRVRFRRHAVDCLARARLFSSDSSAEHDLLADYVIPTVVTYVAALFGVRTEEERTWTGAWTPRSLYETLSEAWTAARLTCAVVRSCVT